MANILDKYKKDSSQTLLNKYKESAQKPSVLENKRVSLNANPVLNDTTVINENILPDLTDKEGKVMSEDADFFTKLFKTGASVVADVLHGIGKSYEDFVDYIGHNYSIISYITTPTHTSEGSINKTCEHCTDTINVTLPILNETDYNRVIIIWEM